MATAASRSSSKLSRSVSSQSNPAQKLNNPSSASSLPSHLAMVELKSRILAALSKLSDRDTYQIAIDDLEKIIRTLPVDGVPMLLNSLLHDPAVSSPSSEPKSSPAIVRRESLRLLALLCTSHPDSAAIHLPKIISHITRRLKDPISDTSVRDACRDAMGALAGLYIRPATAGDDAAASSAVATMFLKPLLEAMGEQNKAVQAGAAACLANVVDCCGVAAAGAVAFQKLCPRICKSLSGQSFLAKAALLSVVSSLSQVGAITPQSMQLVLHNVRECLENNDWATRKAAADALCVLVSHSSHLLADVADSTISALEACRFDKVKPVRDSMMEALHMWKKVAQVGEDGTSSDSKDAKHNGLTNVEERCDNKMSKSSIQKTEPLKDSSLGSPAGRDSTVKDGNSIQDKTVGFLKKKAPSLTDKELNPEFFQKLETRNSGDIEVVVPRKFYNPNTIGEESEILEGGSRGVLIGNQELNEAHENRNIDRNWKGQGTYGKLSHSGDFSRGKFTKQSGFVENEQKNKDFDVGNGGEMNQKVGVNSRANVSRGDSSMESSFLSSKGNWLALQRQLSHLERQQANIMNILQDFIGGSHDRMVNLDNRVRGLERVVEEISRDLAASSDRRGPTIIPGFEGSPGRSSYNDTKFGRIPFAERYFSSDGMFSGGRGRDHLPWRPDTEAWDPQAYVNIRNGPLNSRRGLGAVPSEHLSDHIGSRRAWDKGHGAFRLGEGPSARSIWQASKDEATLEAIRVAGDDNGAPQTTTRGAIRELDAEELADCSQGQGKGSLRNSWTRAMDCVHAGDMDSAYAAVLSTGDDLLLVKLMDFTGPVMDQLSSDIASEILVLLGQYLSEPIFDVALCWIQQLAEMTIVNGPEALGIPLELKRQVLLDLHEACSAMQQQDAPPGEWEGEEEDMNPAATARTMTTTMMQLASAWEIDLQQLTKQQ